MKKSAGDQKRNRDEECLLWAYQQSGLSWERVSKLENISIVTSKTEEQREQRLKGAETESKDCQVTTKGVNICVTGILEREEREKRKNI